MWKRFTLVLLAIALVSVGASNNDDDDGAGQTDIWLPQYHFIPRPFNWMNDPNGLFYDPVFQRYHLMYQYQTPRVWGHAVSDDLVHWTQLPIALENDMWYDQGGVFTGSATILNDPEQTPMLSYSVSTNNMQCLAFPTNRSDPDLVSWTKASYNPIINSANGAPDGRDDTTAWLSPNQTVYYMAYGIVNEAIVYQAPVMNLSDWTVVGTLYSTPTGQWECPDFYSLPNPSATVTHVTKASTEGQDYWVTGFYDNSTVQFTPVANTSIGMQSQLYDHGVYYASKRFYDPSTNRQILFGWVVDMPGSGHNNPNGGGTWSSTQSLPRSVTLDADGQSLNIQPIVELQTLRVSASHVKRQSPTLIPAGAKIPQYDIEGKQLEIIATFSFNQSVSVNCGLNVLVDTANGLESTAVGFQTLGTYMVGMDLPGDDYSVVPETYTDPHMCQAACDADENCVAWAFVIPGGPGGERCCLKNPVPSPVARSYVVSGVKQAQPPSLYVSAANSSLNAGITKNDYSGFLKGVVDSITLHIFVDHSIVEVYANNGQGSTVITNRVYPTLSTSVGVSAFAGMGSACTLTSFEAWELNAAN